MIVGILSDTHDNVKKIGEAFRLFEEHDVGLVLHAGDHIVNGLYDDAPFRMTCVLGNWDDPYRFESYVNAEGFLIEFHEGTHHLKLDGRQIMLYHGNDEIIIKELLNCQKYDLVITGHDHIPKKEVIGETWWLNPGHMKIPVRGNHPDYKNATVALYDTYRNKCEIIEL